MRSLKRTLLALAVLGGVGWAGVALANIMAIRHSGLSCVPAPSVAVKYTGTLPPFPDGGAGTDPGTGTTTGAGEPTFHCPVTLNVSPSETVLSQPVLRVQVLYATAAVGLTVKCMFYLHDNLGGGTWSTWPPLTGNTSAGMWDNQVIFQEPTGVVQLATPNLNRAVFTCSLPKANAVGAIQGMIRAYEVLYGNN